MKPMKTRKRAKKKKPNFNRQEYFKHGKLEKKWRKPKGINSKLKRGEKARGKKPSPGFSSPKAVRGLNPHGLEQVRIFTPAKLTPEMKTKAVVIGSTVGKRKKEEILKKAEQLGIKISNI